MLISVYLNMKYFRYLLVYYSKFIRKTHTLQYSYMYAKSYEISFIRIQVQFSLSFALNFTSF
jgi:hypothetical protein